MCTLLVSQLPQPFVTFFVLLSLVSSFWYRHILLLFNQQFLYTHHIIFSILTIIIILSPPNFLLLTIVVIVTTGYGFTASFRLLEESALRQATWSTHQIKQVKIDWHMIMRDDYKLGVDEQHNRRWTDEDDYDEYILSSSTTLKLELNHFWMSKSFNMRIIIHFPFFFQFFSSFLSPHVWMYHIISCETLIKSNYLLVWMVNIMVVLLLMMMMTMMLVINWGQPHKKHELTMITSCWWWLMHVMLIRKCPNNKAFFSIQETTGEIHQHCVERCELITTCGEVTVPETHLDVSSIWFYFLLFVLLLSAAITFYTFRDDRPSVQY